MAKRGRPRKQGKRTESGRLKRNNYPVPVYDKGSDWVQSMRARFGEHYSTALGRAYATGLLGEGTEAKERYDIGKKLARVRKRYFGHRQVGSALDMSPRGNVVLIVTEEEAEQALADKEWLEWAARKMDKGCVPYLDQLLSDVHADSGPYWLANLIEGPCDRRDKMVLDAALKALDAIVPQRRRLTWVA